MASLLDRLPPQALLIASRGLQSLGTPLVALLITTAGMVGGVDFHPISFCNVLFIGNLAASAVVAGTYGPRTIWEQLRTLSTRSRLEILVFGGLSALLSGLIFAALETTTVTNAVLLARLGPVLYAVASALILAQAIRPAEWTGFALIGGGVIFTVFTGSGFELARGDLLVLASTIVYAVVTLMSKRLLTETQLPAMVFARNFFSAIIFFVIAIVLFGPHHFADAFHGPLWLIMTAYALVVIVAAQLLWYRSLRALTPATFAKWTVFTPALTIGYALILNGERPSVMQVAALGFVTLGIVVSQVGRKAPQGTSGNAESSVAAG